jgi:N-methylhydantoinase A
MHAAEIALEIGIPRISFPPVPGMFSAWGMLAADVRHDLAVTAVAKAADLDAADIEDTFAELEGAGREALRAQHVDAGAERFIRSLDLRYYGQEHALEVEVSPGLDPALLKEIFDQAHWRKYGHHSDEDPVEVVNFRVAAIGEVSKPDLRPAPVEADAVVRPSGDRDVYFDGAFVKASVYKRSDIPAGARFTGPAVIDEEGATLVVPPSFEVFCDPYGSLVLTGDTSNENSKEERSGSHAG